MRTKRYRTLEQKKALWGYLFALPLIFGVVFCFGIPALKASWYSLSDITVGSDGLELQFAGTVNYYDALFKDIYFRERAVSSLLTMLLNIPLMMVFAFFSATVLHPKFRGRALVRALFFLPLALSSAALIEFNLSDALSQVMGGSASQNEALQRMQVYNLGQWLLRNGILPDALAGYISAAFERIEEIIMYSSVQMLIFLAALQSTPKDLYEAARIEGASGWELYWKITFPMASPLLLPCAIYTIVDWSLSARNSALKYISDMGLSNHNFGLSAAMAMIYSLSVLLCVGMVTLLLRKVVKKYEHN
jgi:ABC-type sugar transport system permease subunit